MLKRFADWLRAQRNLPLALIAGIATIAIVGWLSFDVPIDELVGKALGPLTLSPDTTTDDGAGDTLTAAAEAERYLPLPSALEDERVVAAIGPILTRIAPSTRSGFGGAVNDAPGRQAATAAMSSNIANTCSGGCATVNCCSRTVTGMKSGIEGTEPTASGDVGSLPTDRMRSVRSALLRPEPTGPKILRPPPGIGAMSRARRASITDWTARTIPT